MHLTIPRPTLVLLTFGRNIRKYSRNHKHTSWSIQYQIPHRRGISLLLPKWTTFSLHQLITRGVWAIQFLYIRRPSHGLLGATLIIFKTFYWEGHLRCRWYYPRLRSTYHHRSGRKRRTSIRALLVPTTLPTYQKSSRATVIRRRSEITHVRRDVLVPTIYRQGGKITANIRTTNQHYGLQDGQAVHLPQVAKISYDSRRYQEANRRQTTIEKRDSCTTNVWGIS